MLGTRHGHAVGKWQALCANPLVEPVGIYDPEPASKDQFRGARWLPSADTLLEDAETSETPEAAIRRGSLRPALDAIPPEAFLDAYPENIRGAAEALRRLIRRVVPDAIERVRLGWRLRRSG